ncbi:hypothetical protein E2C01_093742 [Portunus trituberculatus]|uniref:Uncharacterized protein n=1 Tax=Portunus trituberculatus TaxID=210409 RepID=A0A5B7K175_PORTR|nr:hypothetical protein [Portunus trituberculatus]
MRFTGGFQEDMRSDMSKKHTQQHLDEENTLIGLA